MKKELESYFSKKENKDKETKSLLSFLTQTLDKVKTGSKEAIQEARTWLTDHAESTKAYLTQNGSKLAQKTLKTLSALVICTALVLGSTGCDKLPGGTSSSDPNHLPPVSFEELPTRPIEDIMNQGIKAEDVLAAYDALAEQIYEAIYFEQDANELDAQFIEITPLKGEVLVKENGEYVYKDSVYPYYTFNDDYTAVYSWYHELNSPYYKENLQPINDVMIVNFGYHTTNEAYSEQTFLQPFAVSRKSFENILSSFNIKKKTLTHEDCYNSDFSADLIRFVGKELFEGFIINRDVIENATEEQLWALYNAINSIKKISFDNINPDIAYEENTDDDNISILG